MCFFFFFSLLFFFFLFSDGTRAPPMRRPERIRFARPVYWYRCKKYSGRHLSSRKILQFFNGNATWTDARKTRRPPDETDRTRTTPYALPVSRRVFSFNCRFGVLLDSSDQSFFFFHFFTILIRLIDFPPLLNIFPLVQIIFPWDYNLMYDIINETINWRITTLTTTRR